MKNKFFLDVQIDKDWSNDVMGIPGDTLGLYGCLVTALSNTKVLQSIPYTPKKLNEELKANKGYAGLRNPKLKENQSFILWTSDAKGKGVCDIIGCKVNKDINLSIKEIDASIRTGKSFFIARVVVSYRNSRGVIVNIGHYINILYILKGKYVCFDTYDGKVNLLNEADITLIIKVDYD